MVQRLESPARTLPSWLVVLGSIVIGGHLLAILVLVLSAPSGPWANPFGSAPAMGPQFATVLNDISTPTYLRALKLTHNYHFITNQVALPGVFFEVKLKDESGREITTLKFPDEKANAWVRHRQTILARGLTDDQILPPQMGEVVAAPQQQVRTQLIWDIVDGRKLKLNRVPQHLVPRDRPVFTPSDWSQTLARSYVRYLCRKHGAASGELIRHTQDPISPAMLLMGEPPAGAYDSLIANFGELPQ